VHKHVDGYGLLAPVFFPTSRIPCPTSIFKGVVGQEGPVSLYATAPRPEVSDLSDLRKERLR